MRVSLTGMRQVTALGGFFDAGVKKLAMALLVVVDCCLRLTGGGETEPSSVLTLFKPAVMGVAMVAVLRERTARCWVRKAACERERSASRGRCKALCKIVFM